MPIENGFDQARLGWLPADRSARVRLVADAHGLDREEGRKELLAAIDVALTRGEEFVRRRVEAGDPNFVEMWNQADGAERYCRRRRWWNDNHQNFATALR